MCRRHHNGSHPFRTATDPRLLGNHRGDAKYLAAIERYYGPLWRTLRAVDPNGQKAKVTYLSAHLGFREASVPMELYDAWMTPQISGATEERVFGLPLSRQ